MWLAEVRADGVPSEEAMVRLDNGGEFFGGKFDKLCHARNIIREYIAPGCPKLNGVVERGLSTVEMAGLAATVQAQVLFPGFNIPEGKSLFYDAFNWVAAQ